MNKDTSYGFYSKLLNKPFDTLDELKAAEAKVEEEKKAKELKEEARKSDAELVQKAFDAKVAAKKEFNEEVKKLVDEYQKQVDEVNKTFRETYSKLVDKKNVADEVYDKVFAEFEKKHPEGYHLTLHNGDSRAEYYSKKNSAVNSADMESAFYRWFSHWL